MTSENGCLQNSSVMQQEALYSMASQLSAVAQLRNAQAMQFGSLLPQPTQFSMPGGMSAIQQVIPMPSSGFPRLSPCAVMREGSKKNLNLPAKVLQQDRRRRQEGVMYAGLPANTPDCARARHVWWAADGNGRLRSTAAAAVYCHDAASATKQPGSARTSSASTSRAADARLYCAACHASKCPNDGRTFLTVLNAAARDSATIDTSGSCFWNLITCMVASQHEIGEA